MQSRKPTKVFCVTKSFFYEPTKNDRQFSASDSCDTSEMQGLLAEEVKLNLLLQISVNFGGSGDQDF